MIDVWIYFTDSEDHLRVRVPPSLRLGPLPGAAGPRAAGPGASGRGSRLLSPSQWRPESLKGLIEGICEIEVDRQRLFFNQNVIMNDDISLKAYGIGDGDQLNLRILKHGSHSHGGTESSLEPGSHVQRGDKLAGKYSGWTLANTRLIKQCRDPHGEVYMQPKWVTFAPQASKRASLAAACSEASRGPFGTRLDHPIYVRDRDDSHMRSLRLRLSAY
ncbi:unnamed protein product [Prorocentrum cordatum]|uniref:Ubiquitin-like domain-containing protein n=1 Tax=Prorocentrum cordatum TaxID=2364126 RepID=A0ABN9V324_9DINO|nr:unnamed protein product [Polarella glacialis]